MTTEQEALREKVARALCAAADDDWGRSFFSMVASNNTPKTGQEAYRDLADAAIAVVLKEAASRVREKMYMLNIGTPGEGPFTAQDRVCCETREQAADFILSLIPQEDGK